MTQKKLPVPVPAVAPEPEKPVQSSVVHKDEAPKGEPPKESSEQSVAAAAAAVVAPEKPLESNVEKEQPPVVEEEKAPAVVPEPEKPAAVQQEEPPKEDAAPEPPKAAAPKKPLPTLTRSVATVHRPVAISPPPEDTSYIKVTVPPAPVPAPAPALPPPPVCAGCQKPIDDADCMVAEGAHYHDACFVCSVCRAPLTEYYRAEDGLRCPQCYRMAHPFEVCASCGQPITDESLLAGTMRFHRACFVCAACHAPLGTHYVLHQGRFYCAPRSDGSVPCACAASAPCAACGRPVVPGDRVVRTDDGARYHSQCFVCGFCAACLTAAEYCRVDVGAHSRLCCDPCSRTI